MGDSTLLSGTEPMHVTIVFCLVSGVIVLTILTINESTNNTQDPDLLQHQVYLVAGLHAQVSACGDKKEELNTLVDKMVKVFDQERQKNMNLDGLIENCQEDKTNV